MRVVAKVRIHQPQESLTGRACRGEYQQRQRHLRATITLCVRLPWALPMIRRVLD